MWTSDAESEGGGSSFSKKEKREAGRAEGTVVGFRFSKSRRWRARPIRGNCGKQIPCRVKCRADGTDRG